MQSTGQVLSFTHTPKTPSGKTRQQVVLTLSESLFEALKDQRDIMYGDLTISMTDGRWYGTLNTESGHYVFSKTSTGNSRRIKIPCVGLNSDLTQLPLSGITEVSQFVVDGKSIVFEIPEAQPLTQYKVNGRRPSDHKITRHRVGNPNIPKSKLDEVNLEELFPSPPQNISAPPQDSSNAFMEQAIENIALLLGQMNTSNRLRVLGEFQRIAVTDRINELTNNGHKVTVSTTLDENLPYVFVEYQTVVTERF